MSTYWQKWYKKNKDRFLKTVNTHKKKRRAKFQSIINLYKNGPCIICGAKFEPVAMDFYHRDKSDKKFRISDAKRLIYNIDKLINEIKKCDLYCAVCRRIVEVEEVQKNKKQFSKKKRRNLLRQLINQTKAQPCADCGKIFPSYAMELDHIADNKIDSVSKMISQDKSLSDINNELDKTQVVCLCCHRVRTQNRKLDNQ